MTHEHLSFSSLHPNSVLFEDQWWPFGPFFNVLIGLEDVGGRGKAFFIS